MTNYSEEMRDKCDMRVGSLDIPMIRTNRFWRYAPQLLTLLALTGSQLPCFAANGPTLTIYASPQLAGAPDVVESCRVDSVSDCSTTLVRAIDLIQGNAWQERLLGRFSKVQVRVAAGVHRLEQELTLHWGQGATSDISLEIVGEGSGSVIAGSAVIKTWHKPDLSTLPKRVRRDVGAHLLVTNVSEYHLPINDPPQSTGYGIPIRPVTTELFVDSQIQLLAKWPNTGYGRILRPQTMLSDDAKTFSIAGRNAADWLDEPDLKVLAFWRWDWAAQGYLVGTKDAANNQLTLLGAGSPYGIKAGQRAIVENALSELDSPGEWYLDRASATLYYWPVSDALGNQADISIASGLLRVLNSRNVRISKLQLAKVRGDAVRIEDSQNIVLDNVEIRLTGNRGLVIDNCQDSGVSNSIIEDTGEGGVFLAGGDRKHLVSARNFVEKTSIRRFSRLAKTYRFAVEVRGVGQRVIGNVITDGPHTAILFSGNDHTIAANEISNVVKETSDSGAIYVGRDFTVHGTVIEGNFLHDIQPYEKEAEVKGIYIDDQASGITVRKNIFARVQQPVFIGGGRDNSVENNLFYFSSPGIHLDARGVEGQLAVTLDPNSTWQKNLDAVPIQSGEYARRFPHLARIREDDFGMPKYNSFKKNLIIGGEVAVVSDRAKSGILIQDNRVAGEEAFVLKKAPALRTAVIDFALVPSYK